MSNEIMILLVTILFIILVSLQYTLNKVLLHLKNIENLLRQKKQ